MATAGIPKRSSRLASREPIAKAISERKLRSGKAISINKSVQKVNISARNKKLRVSVKDAPQNSSQSLSKRLRPRKNKRNYCEDSKLLQLHIPSKQQNSMVILEKLNLTDNKKVPVYETIKSFEKSLKEKNDDVYDFTFDSDNTEEKIAKKRKRKRNVNKAKGKVKKSVRKKVIQSKPMTNKTSKPPELDTKLPARSNSSEPAESVIMKSTKKSIMEKPKTDMVIQKLEESVEEDISISKAETLKINTDIQTAKKSIKEDGVKLMETSGLNIASQIAEEWVNEDIMEMETIKKDTNIQTTEDTTLADRTVANQDASKPRIISIENADNIIITKSPRNIEDLRPFRPKNISNNKTPMKESTNTLNYSLLTKSLSPILKTSNTLNTESPWCPATVSMFSGTKHFLQSTPNTNFKVHKQKMEKNKGNAEMKKENVEIDKENVDINKENKCINRKERKKKAIGIYKKHILLKKKLPMNQISENVQTTYVNNPVVKPVPARMLFGEIKNLLQTNNNKDEKQMKPDVNENGKQQTTHAEADILSMEKNKSLVDLVNFSDTFDVMSDTERQSNIGIDVPLFVDLEPSHFVEPPQHSYKRRRGVRFNFLQESCEEDEEEEENNKLHAKKKKKKLTKTEKEHTKRVDDWVKSINSTFEEIDKYDLLVE
ncbi:DNA ligase 1 [Linepithema humile]|uniref:DNA ligase 1 n=1 Tax=Linepithema humile TaxID=83485 RepID=UPI0006236480|nr:PREDICTED: uncharacterized protein LOC105677436 [Linepithema humile]